MHAMAEYVLDMTEHLLAIPGNLVRQTLEPNNDAWHDAAGLCLAHACFAVLSEA